MNFDDLMRNALFSLLVLFAAFAAPRTIAAEEWPEIANARASVRLWADNSGSCSVVIVAPGHGYTAAHCENLVPEGLIEGKRVVSFERIGTSDTAKIVVPGVGCPCAPLASKPAELGDVVFGVGYPYAAVRMLMWGWVQESPLIPELAGMRVASFGAAPGSSGGGVFTRNGRLLGVISATFKGISLTIYSEVPLP